MAKTPIEQMLDQIDFKPLPEIESNNPENLPFVTHEGILRIENIELKVYQLNTGQRIIDEESLMKFLGILE